MLLRDWRSIARGGLVFAAAALWVLAGAMTARADDAQSYLADAKARLEKGDLKGAEVQLRNAVRERPDDAAIHAELAQIYLKLDNLPAAEAEARVVQQKHGAPDLVDPVLAEALRREGKITPLFELIKPGNREAKAESTVRLNLGLAHLQLQEYKDAEPLLRDAERLDDQALGPKLAMAQYLIATGDLDAAAAEVKRAHELAPEDATVLLLESQIFLGRNDDDAALARLTELLAKNPDDVRALLGRATLYFRKRDADAAERDLTHALKVAPKNPMVIFLDSVLVAQKGDLKKADDVLTEIVPIFTSMPAGYYVQGIVKYGLGEYAQAEASLTKYLARAPKDANARRILAEIALRRRDAKSAIQILQPVIDADPTNIRAIALLAQSYVATGQRDKALALYQHAADFQPANADLQTASAVEKLQLGVAADGIKDLEKILDSKEGSASTATILVLSDLRAGKIAEAAEAAEAMAKRDSKDLIAQNLLGMVRGAQGNYQDAVTIFKAILAKSPNLAPVRLNLARAYVFMQQTADAQTVLRELLKEQPNNVEALTAMANIAASEKDYAAAADFLKQAQQASAKDPAPGLRLLDLYASTKDWDKVKSAGRSLEGQFPGNPPVIDRLARLLVSAGDPAGAASEYQKLTQLFPQAPLAWSTYSRFQFTAGDKNGARQSAAKALELVPRDLNVMQQVVDLDLNMKGPDAALKTAQSFASKDQVASDLLVAAVLVRSNRSTEAIDQLTRAQRQHPAEAIAVKLGDLTYAAGRHEEAERLLESWVKDHPDTLGARLALANYYMLNKDLKRAQPIYEKVLALAPDNAIALNNLASIYTNSDDARARDYAMQAYWRAPVPQFADTLGWTLVLDGKADDGIYYLRRASEALPTNDTVQYHLAAALDKVGDRQSARNLLEKVLKSKAEFEGKEDAQKLLAKLQQP